MSMKIGINTLFLIPNQVGGTEYYTRSLLKYLEKTDKHNQYYVFCNKENDKTFSFDSPRWKKIVCPINANNRAVRILYEQFILPFYLHRYDCELIHSFGYFGPLLTPGIKQIITVHDTNWKDHPEDNSILSNILLQFFVEKNIESASTVITDSQFSKKKLERYFPQHKNKVRIISPGVEDSFLRLLRKPSTQPLAEERFILSVGAFYPHKKTLYLLELWQKILEIDKTLFLVIIGKNGKDEKRVLEKIKKLDRVKYFPKVSFERLVSLYSHTSLFIHSSIYEGFGYPVYEAVSANKIALVGDKNLYDNSIHDCLYQLTFEPQKDAELVLNKLGKVAKCQYKQSYESSAKDLVQAYKNYEK